MYQVIFSKSAKKDLRKLPAKVIDLLQEEISKRGFSPVKNLSGHGLAKFVIHDHPSIPNFDTGSDEALKEDQVIAIEPFASMGAGMIYESSNPSIFAVSGRKSVRSSITRQVLKDIESFKVEFKKLEGV